MRQRATWLVVVALAALGIAAAVDALRGGELAPGRARPAARTRTTTVPNEATSSVPVAQARELSGVLYYTGAGCVLRALQLPSAAAADAPTWNGCRFSLSPTGRTVQPAEAAWSPDGRSYVTEADGLIAFESGRRVLRGRSPAWRADGSLTYVRDNAIVNARSGRVLMSRRTLRAALGRDPNVPPDELHLRAFRVKRIAWLSKTRLVAILGVDVLFGPHEELLAIFEQGRVVRVLAGLGRRFHDLRVSPRGSFVALRVATGSGFMLVNRDGKQVRTPTVTGYRAIAWSPDERWAALAARTNIYVFRVDTTEFRLRRLPIEAHDLAWRTAGQAPPLGPTSSVSRFLERLGVAGTLYVSDADCRIRALGLPGLVWRDPGGVRAPCRFSVGPDGTVSDDWIVWPTRGPLAAGCHANAVDVFDRDQRVVFHRGSACHPAWQPDGTLTYLARGELIRTARFRGERVLLSRAVVAKALGRQARLKEVAWLDDSRVAAAVRRGRVTMLVVFDGHHLVHPPGFAALRIWHLRAGRSIIAALTNGPGGPSVTFFDPAGGRTFAIRGHAFDWSPTGTVAAVAGRDRIVFVESTTGAFRSLDVYAADVEWR